MDRKPPEAVFTSSATIARAEFRSYSDEAQLHRHDYHQLVLPWRGVLEMEVQQQEGRIAPETGAFIAAGVAHTFRAKDSNTFIVADIASPYIAPVGFLPEPYFHVSAEIQGLIDFLGARAIRGPVPQEIVVSWSRLLVDSLSLQPIPRTRNQAKLQKALSFMRGRLGQPLSISDVASECGLSPSRLYALFQDQMGRGPYAVLTDMRLNRAKQLLEQTDLSIAEIAVRTGFADQSSLTRKMRAAHGVTPAACRRASRIPARSGETA